MAEAVHPESSASDRQDVEEEEEVGYERADLDEEGQEDDAEEAEDRASGGTMLEDAGHILLNGRLGSQVPPMPCLGETNRFWSIPERLIMQERAPSESSHSLNPSLCCRTGPT